MIRQTRLKKKYYCIECGAEIPARRRWRRGLCVECAARHQRENAEQLHAKSGPYYELWLAKWRASLKAQLGAGGEGDAGDHP
jgi:hypothetical protein